MNVAPSISKSVHAVSHAVFTLAFGFAAIAVAARANHGWPGLRVFLSVSVALVCFWLCTLSVRTRTSNRVSLADGQLPTQTSQAIAPKDSYTMLRTVLSCVGLIVTSSFLNAACIWLVLILLVCVACSSAAAARFTYFVHLCRGLTLGFVPVYAWLGVKGTNATLAEVLQITALFIGVTLWATGFDAVYAVPKHQFDRHHGFDSLAVVWGPTNALTAAFIIHMLAAGALFVFGLLCGFRVAYLVGWLLIVGCFLLEYWIARHRSLHWIELSFPRLNTVVSAVFVAVTVAEVVFAGGFKIR